MYELTLRHDLAEAAYQLLTKREPCRELKVVLPNG
jgi:hypothetical protein